MAAARLIGLLLPSIVSLTLAATAQGTNIPPLLSLSSSTCEITVDGRLDEPCYRGRPTVARFVVASKPRETAPATQAWVSWNSDRLVVSFDAVDRDIEVPYGGKEHDVDQQDRVEVFLWSGLKSDPYFCIEIGARGARHDYLARFYRQFDSGWNMDGMRFATSVEPGKYQVEIELSREVLARLGFNLTAGSRWRLGLFRADFTSGEPEPVWITWVDAGTPVADFHVAEAFGEIALR